MNTRSEEHRAEEAPASEAYVREMRRVYDQMLKEGEAARHRLWTFREFEAELGACSKAMKETGSVRAMRYSVYKSADQIEFLDFTIPVDSYFLEGTTSGSA